MVNTRSCAKHTGFFSCLVCFGLTQPLTRRPAAPRGPPPAARAAIGLTRLYIIKEQNCPSGLEIKVLCAANN